MSISFFEKLHKNVRFNFYNYALALGIGLFLTPIVVKKLGGEQYGLWVMTGFILGYFGFMDLGLNRAAVRHISMSYSSDDKSRLSAVINSCLITNVILGTLAFAALFLLNGFLVQKIFKISEGLIPYARTTIYILSVIFLFRFPGATFDSILTGLQRIDLSQTINIISTILRAAATVAVLYSGGNVVGLMWVSFAFTILNLIALLIVTFILLPSIRIDFKNFSRRVLKELFIDGFYQTLIGATTQLGFYTDRILISSLIGISMVTPYQLANMIAMLPFTISHNFFTPVYALSAEMKARNDLIGLKKLFISGTKMTTMISFGLGLFLFCSSDQIYLLWMGPEYQLSARLMRLLVAIWTLASLNTIGCGIFWGQEPPRWHGFTQIVFAVVSLTSGFFLIKKFGIWGAGYSFGIGWFVSFVLLGIKLLKVAGVKFKEFFNEVFRFEAALAIISYYIFTALLKHFNYIAAILATLIFFGIISLKFYFTDDEKRKIKSIYRIAH